MDIAGGDGVPTGMPITPRHTGIERMRDAAMRERIAGIVGAEHVADAAGFAPVDGICPVLAARPADAAQTAEILKAAAAERWAVIPRGSGAMLGLGNPPRAGDLWVSTGRMRAVTEYEPADLTAAAGAGCTLGDLNAKLAAHDQVLPWDPPGASTRTLGGMAAIGRSGPLRLGFGQPRDWIIGIEFATPEGNVIRAGGRVVKNVAGYDLTKLVVGSLGTLGIITALNLRVRPRPSTEITISALSVDRADLFAFVRDVRESHVAPVAMELLSAGAARACGIDIVGRQAVLVARLAGEDADVRAEVLAFERIAAARGISGAPPVATAQVARFWTSVADLPLYEDAPVVLRLSVAPSRLAATIDLAVACAEEVMEEVVWTAGPGTGTQWLLLGGAAVGDRTDELAACVEKLRRECVDAGGSLVVARAPVELKRRVDVWGPVAAEGLVRATKQLFDPAGVLNPGRFVAGI